MTSRANAGSGHGATVVLGIGNPLMSDDGAGIAALEALQRDPSLRGRVRLVDGSTAGPDLLGALVGCTALLVLDAVDVGEAPGQVVRLELDDGFGRAEARTAHDLGLASVLADLRLLGEFPDSAVMLGIQPACVAVGTTLSPPVARGIETLVRSAIDLLKAWSDGGAGQLTAGNAAV